VIALIDYKAGNLTSVKKALAAIGADVFVPAVPGDLADAGGIIVPGVGHFGATRALDQSWIDAILARLGEGRPLFGICLGMQWLYEGSDEAPDLAGLGLLSGRCYRLGTVRPEPDAVESRLQLRPDTTDDGRDGRSVRLQADRSVKVAPVSGDTVAVTEHGERFAAIVQRGYVAGVQFHPEKSGDVGLRILRNFVELVG
jgi:glutamine amidotransferase